MPNSSQAENMELPMTHYIYASISMTSVEFDKEADIMNSTGMLSKAIDVLSTCQNIEDKKRFTLIFMLLLIHMANRLSLDNVYGSEFLHMIKFWKEVYDIFNSLSPPHKIVHPDLFLQTSDPLERLTLVKNIIDFYKNVLSVDISILDKDDRSGPTVTAYFLNKPSLDENE